MKTLFNLIFFISGMLLLYSCTRSEDDIAAKCGEQKTFTDELTAEEKAKVPYTGFDTLTFVRTTVGDTHTFIGTGKNAGYATASVYSGDPDCPDNSANLEYMNYKFVSETFVDPINLKVHIKSYKGFRLFDINFKQQQYSEGIITIGKPYFFFERIILSKTYYNLNYIGNFNNSLDTSYYLLYNANDGIVEIKLPNGERWGLLSKK